MRHVEGAFVHAAPSITMTTELSANAEAFARLFEAVHEGVYIGIIHGPQTRTVSANPHLKLMFGFAADTPEADVRPFETDRFVDKLEKAGTMPIFTRALHRFIGAAIGTRSEVLSVLHLFDKPDAAWDDPGAEKIYEQLRAEFDLIDRHEALELKLRSVQDALELVTDVARDKRLVWLEISIVLLIVLEIGLNLFRH